MFPGFEALIKIMFLPFLLKQKKISNLITAIMKNYNKDIKIQKAKEKNHCSHRKKNSKSGREGNGKKMKEFLYAGMKGKNKTRYSEKS